MRGDRQPMVKSRPTTIAAASAQPALPETREALLDLHRETRAKRNAAPHGSAEQQAAIDLLGRIEIEVARIERAMDPPRG